MTWVKGQDLRVKLEDFGLEGFTVRLQCSSFLGLFGYW